MSAVMRQKANPSTSAQQLDLSPDADLHRLFTGEENGHLSPYVYLNGGADTLAKFYGRHKGYYPNFGEIDFLNQKAATIASAFADTKRLIIVGPGPADESLFRKEGALLPHLPYLENVHLIDVSRQFCEDGKIQLARHFNRQNKKISVDATVADYTDAARHFAQQRQNNTTVISVGSLLSNVHQRSGEDFPDEQLSDFLRAMKNLTGRGKNNKVVIGYDACQDEQQVLGAYKGGLFDAVILGGLQHAFSSANRISGMNPQRTPEFFRRVSVWQPSVARHNAEVTKPLHLVFKDENGRDFDERRLRRGDQFTIVNSVKPPEGKIRNLGMNAGLQTEITMGSKHGLVEHVMSCV